MNNMKKLLMVCLFISTAMFSCGKKPQEELAKTWQVNAVETETRLPESVKNAIIANSKMVFTKDGKYTTTGGIGADQGTYVLDAEGKNLSTTSTAGKSNEQYVIKKLDKDNLVLTNKGNIVTCIAVN